ncbi:hypothetical protein CTAYLR_003488 [Chrysophaeum taylorii]|uniref:Pre-mRNA-splicing factor 38 n=1 Tax=Chrysophaeum taylorii TaxID=2483200 RepID=A0AAD7XIZ9_9STRA|nr:hypothetical protein CTAYLR_003488 [Chrysophaeum taylorii]
MATWVNNLGLETGSHLVSGSTLMPKWEDRSGIPIVNSKVNLLPKNLPQEPMARGPLFEIWGGPGASSFNLPPITYQKINESEYFKCLYVFRSFEKVVDVIYEKVTYVEPYASTAKTPSSAYCLLLKLFTLRLTEDQVKQLLDHPDSTYIRALGALYVRYGAEPSKLWRWLGDYCDDLEEFAPSMNPHDTTTFGQFVTSLFDSSQYFGTPLPRVPLPVERRIKVNLVLDAEQVARGKKNLRHNIQPGARVRAIYTDPDTDEMTWCDATVVKIQTPYEGAPEGTLPRCVVDFRHTKERVTLKLGHLSTHRRHGDSVTRGTNLMSEVVRRDRESAVAESRFDVHRSRPSSYNMGLITSDRNTYRKRSRERDQDPRRSHKHRQRTY